jgi:fibronectin-binding autotransporter adhesin
MVLGLPAMGRRNGHRWAVVTTVALAAAITGGPFSAAADRYWDTSNTTGLQGGSGSLNGSNWSTNVSGTGTRTTIGSSNDVFFQATDAPLTYSGTFTNGTDLTIGNWTVANQNVVSTKRSTTGAGGSTFTISGTILVTGTSSMNWELLSWSLGGTPALTISQSSTNTIVGNATGDKTLAFGALTFGAGNNALRLSQSGETSAVAATFTSLSGAAGNSIVLDRSNYSLTLNNTDASSFSGVISGSGSVTKQGAGSLTLGGSNTYLGPTTISGGSLVFGAAHVLPNASAVTLSNATLTTGSFADTVASFTSGTGTINMTIASGTVGSLSMGGLTLNGSNTLAVSLDNPTLGRYSLFNYSGSRTGTFSTVSGAPNWNVVYGSASNSTIDLQQKANQAWAVTPANSRALVNTNVALTGLLTNTSGSGAASLTVSASSTGQLSVSGLPTGTVVGGSSATVNATIAAGSTLGARTWTIVNTDANAITTSATATGTITVVNQRTFTTSTSTLALGLVHQGASFGSPTVVVTSTGLLASTASGTLGAFTGGPAGLSLTTSDPVAFVGASATQSATYTLGGLATTAGTVSGTFTSNVSAEFGSIPSIAVAVTGQVFSGTATWNVAGGGAWGSGASANWTSSGNVGAAPGTFVGYTDTDVAIFAGSQTGTSTILLDGATPSLASIVFSSTAGRYVIGPGSGGSLTLDAASGKPVVDVLGTHEIATAIVGTDGLDKTGVGMLTLSGSSNFSGGTDISAGTLAIDGFLGGDVNVRNDAVLAGSGFVGGNVVIDAGGILAPGNPLVGTLAIGGNLVLDSLAELDFALNALDTTVGGGVNDLVTVGGDLTLAGILNVAAIGDFATAADFSKWRLFNYSGTLTNNGLTFGSMPSLGSPGRFFQIDTSTPGQVNLIAVPEPGSLALAGVGVGIAGWWLARRQRRSF